MRQTIVLDESPTVKIKLSDHQNYVSRAEAFDKLVKAKNKQFIYLDKELVYSFYSRVGICTINESDAIKLLKNELNELRGDYSKCVTERDNAMAERSLYKYMGFFDRLKFLFNRRIKWK